MRRLLPLTLCLPLLSWGQAMAAADVEPAEAIVAKAPRKARCTTCGVVESIRRIDAGRAAAPTYEFTVRLRDGSARTSTVSSPSGWRTGDRVMLMGGGS